MKDIGRHDSLPSLCSVHWWSASHALKPSFQRHFVPRTQQKSCIISPEIYPKRVMHRPTAVNGTKRSICTVMHFHIVKQTALLKSLNALKVSIHRQMQNIQYVTRAAPPCIVISQLGREFFKAMHGNSYTKGRSKLILGPNNDSIRS